MARQLRVNRFGATPTTDKRLHELEVRPVSAGGGGAHASTHNAAGSDPLAGVSQSQITNLVADLAGKAAASHPHVAADVTDFAESVDDRVAALLVAGTNITLTYADGPNTLTVDAAAGGSVSINETVIDIGATAVASATVTVTDAGVSPTSQIMVTWGAVRPADQNSPEFDDVSFFAVPGTGSFTVTAATADGRNRINGLFRINYLVG